MLTFLIMIMIVILTIVVIINKQIIFEYVQ